MVKRNQCLRNKKEGGDCLLTVVTDSAQTTPGQQPGPKEETEVPDIPDLPDLNKPQVPVLDRGSKEPSYKYEGPRDKAIQAEKKATTDVDKIKARINQLLAQGPPERKVDVFGRDTARYAARKANRLALKANAALIGVDLANDLYENWNKFNSVADIATFLVQKGAAEAEEAAKAIWAIAHGLDLTLPDVAGFIGIPIATRAVDNLADLLGIQSDVTGTTIALETDLNKAVNQAIDEHVPEPVQEAADKIVESQFNNTMYSPGGTVVNVIRKGLGGIINDFFK